MSQRSKCRPRICVALTALASFAIKATGPAILGNRPLPSRARGVIALLAPALLAGLVISDILGPNWSSANGPLALGVVTAVAVAVTVTAVARAAL
jgi:branched-subunit amino acid transport protein